MNLIKAISCDLVTETIPNIEKTNKKNHKSQIMKQVYRYEAK